MKEKPAMYDWIQQRVAERRKEKKFLNILSTDEQEAIKRLNDETMKQAEEEKKRLLTASGLAATSSSPAE